jgi:hypothetical protein
MWYFLHTYLNLPTVAGTKIKLYIHIIIKFNFKILLTLNHDIAQETYLFMLKYKVCDIKVKYKSMMILLY